MIKGVRYQAGMDCERLMEVGLVCVEFPYIKRFWEINREAVNRSYQKGLAVSAGLLEEDGFLKILNTALEMKASYIVLETIGMSEVQTLRDLICQHMDKISECDFQILIENGFKENGALRPGMTEFSQVSILGLLVDELNLELKRECFGICLNTGYGILLKQNIGAMVEELGGRIKLLHASDNDGTGDQRQLPYTFTKGRGALTTDWYGVIGSLCISKYEGPVVFLLEGLWNVAPSILHETWYQLVEGIGAEWEQALELEHFLRQKGCLILFGAGNIFENYMRVWGSLYPPDFVVDNKETLWGERRFGVEIRSPQSILSYEEDNRRVLICTAHYVSIKRQLNAMGIRFWRYEDRYFLRLQGGQEC